MGTAYVKQVWTDGASSASAARLNYIEDGIYNAHFQPAARVTHNANQAITTGVETALAFNTELFDTDTIHDTVTNNSRLTCKTAGKYIIGGHVVWDAIATGTYRQVRIKVNGTTAIALQLEAAVSVSAQSITTAYDLAVNDYVQLLVTHDRGANLNVLSTTSEGGGFWMARIA